MTRGWVRGALFAALMVLGSGYIGAYILFIRDSRDFIVVEENRRARDYGASHPATVPTTMSFDSASPGSKLLGGGWHRPQADGTWSSMRESFIAFRAAHVTGALRLRIQADSFVTAHHAQTVVICANGHALSTTTRTTDDSSAPIDLVIPSSELGDGNVLLEFRVDRLASPIAVDAGLDSRALGLRLRSIDLLAP